MWLGLTCFIVGFRFGWFGGLPLGGLGCSWVALVFMGGFAFPLLFVLIGWFVCYVCYGQIGGLLWVRV